MATELYSGTATIGATPWSLTTNSTTPGSITTDATWQAHIDFSNLTITEQYRIQVFEKVIASGPERLYMDSVVAGPMPVLIFPGIVFLHGWDVRLTKLAGTDRSISWSIRQA